MSETLVIIPCGKGKVWDAAPMRGPVQAKDAYTGAPFKVNRQYAESFGDRWIILSAKYGFVNPEDLIPANYNVTFKKPGPDLVDPHVLRQQVIDMGLGEFARIIGLGGVGYRVAIQGAFAGDDVSVTFPFAGLTVGKGMQAIKASLARRATEP